MINLIENDRNYHVYFDKKKIGDFDLDVDGYYHFWPNPSLNGSTTSNILRLIADELDKVNKDWDDNIKEYFNKN